MAVVAAAASTPEASSGARPVSAPTSKGQPLVAGCISRMNPMLPSRCFQMPNRVAAAVTSMRMRSPCTVAHARALPRQQDRDEPRRTEREGNELDGILIVLGGEQLEDRSPEHDRGQAVEQVRQAREALPVAHAATTYGFGEGHQLGRDRRFQRREERLDRG